KWIDPVRQTTPLALEAERNILPLAVKQRFVLAHPIPERSSGDIQPAAAKSGIAEILVVGIEHSRRVVDPCRECFGNSPLLGDQLIFGIPLRKALSESRVINLRKCQKAVARTVGVEGVRPLRRDDISI